MTVVSDKPTAETIFLAAVELPPDRRAAYLIEACGGDRELLVRVERLLAAQSQVEGFLETPAPELGAVDGFRLEQPGTVIGPYTLVEQIGEGGFGVVFLAEQATPIRRRVALKIIKPGMDTRQVVARFEAERQALALMDHPAIAKVFDAGVTEQGRSYFVMELVAGVPINEYCDQCNLPTRERLELFMAVCQAVQHAHQKGIIHRDLKPTNVLVALQDGRPTPKIIDFGIAKAIDERLTEHTLTTGYAQLVGTPMYMSPEQAELSRLGVDTRTDIYSLGVLLYELLAGTTPFDKDRLHAASYDELRRIIREEEPPRPSARISTMAADLATTVAECHRTERHRLQQSVRGDLDWIVMTCLDKDRNRRYESAGSLACDVERYLADEPVRACPPSAGYRFRKYARRHKVSLAVTGLVATLLVTSVIVLLVSNARIRRASAAKDAALATARDAVDQMLTRVGDEKLLNVPLAGPLRKSLLEDALRFYEGFTEQAESDPSVRLELAGVLRRMSDVQRQLGRDDDARQSQEHSIQLLQSLVESNPTEPTYREKLADAHNFLVDLINPYPFSANFEDAHAHLREAQRICEALERDFPDRPPVSAGPMKSLADRIFSREPAEGEQLYRQSIAQLDARVQCSPAPTPWQWLEPSLARFSLAARWDDGGPDYQPAECEKLYLQAIEGAKRALALEPESIGIHTNLGKMRKEFGDLYDRMSRTDEAVSLYREARQDYQFVASRSPWVAYNWVMVREVQVALVDKLQSTGRPAEALEAVEEYRTWSQKTAMLISDDPQLKEEVRETQSQLVDLLRLVGDTKAANEVEQSVPAAESFTIDDVPQNDSERLAKSLDILGLALNVQWEIPEAEAMHRKALEIWRKRDGGKHPAMIRSLWLLADALMKDAKLAEARETLHEADRLEREYTSGQGTGIDLPAQLSPARFYNTAAWTLATLPREQVDDAQLAIKFSKRAIALVPTAGDIWNTLGVAEYRAGNWNAAIKALEKSTELSGDENAIDWFFLSMAYQQLGHHDEARQLYEQAVEWMERNQPQNEELCRFRLEAEQLLKTSDHRPATRPQSK
ncbi:MAG: protein kinase [Pirellulales bacterium]